MYTCCPVALLAAPARTGSKAVLGLHANSMIGLYTLQHDLACHRQQADSTEVSGCAGLGFFNSVKLFVNEALCKPDAVVYALSISCLACCLCTLVTHACRQ